MADDPANTASPALMVSLSRSRLRLLCEPVVSKHLSLSADQNRAASSEISLRLILISLTLKFHIDFLTLVIG